MELAEEAERHGDGHGFFDIDVEALDVVGAEDGEEGIVVGVELGGDVSLDGIGGEE